MRKGKRIFIKVVILSFLILFYNNTKIIKNEKVGEKYKIDDFNEQKKLITNKNYETIHTRILRESAAECTLFLNKNDEFPIDKPCNVLLLGSGARDTLKGGLGSGAVDSKYTTCEEGLENAGFKITSKNWLSKSKYPLEKEHNDVKGDIAVYVLARESGQGMDREVKKGDVLFTNTEINNILYLHKNYKKFMLVLNVCGVVDLSPVKEVSNILILSQLGRVTGDILADIILGKQNPSGKLATTWAKAKDYKFIKEFGNPQDTNYIEGVYVGYRYFNSAGIKPLYPFGYGKSYTSFEISKISLTNIKDEINIKVKVKNIGKYSGKEVIQIYVSPSQENENKPYQSLVSFKKTKELKPLEEEEMELLFKLRNIARYDIKKACYILDKGKYIIRVGNSSEDTNIYGYIELDEDIITEQLRNIYVEDLGFEDYKVKVVLKDDLTHIQKIKLAKKDFHLKKVEYNYKFQINDKISKLKDNDLANLCIGDYTDINEKMMGVGGLTTKSVEDVKEYIRMADGPAGLRVTKILDANDKVYDEYVSALPIETALAQTFNTDLIEKYGNIIGKEMEILKIQLLLAPALNIHRNILCGRNYEYFSEDPLISGKMAAAITKGVQSYKNKGTTLKHLVANNQEKINIIIIQKCLREH